jgi:hypothetical protein
MLVQLGSLCLTFVALSYLHSSLLKSVPDRAARTLQSNSDLSQRYPSGIEFPGFLNLNRRERVDCVSGGPPNASIPESQNPTYNYQLVL